LLFFACLALLQIKETLKKLDFKKKKFFDEHIAACLLFSKCFFDVQINMPNPRTSLELANNLLF